jgi:acyl-coenzyme A thioesterase PaaI-like protein
MTQRTHLGIHADLVGTVTTLSPGSATVTLTATPPMAADDRGLVHGGFTFGLADYAAMCAVNDPNVVLGAAETRFLGPVVSGQVMVAEATVSEEKGRKRSVKVSVKVGGAEVMSGTFTCFVLDHHVLDR